MQSLARVAECAWCSLSLSLCVCLARSSESACWIPVESSESCRAPARLLSLSAACIAPIAVSHGIATLELLFDSLTLFSTIGSRELRREESILRTCSYFSLERVVLGSSYM
jgi:hypothetical protein